MLMCKCKVSRVFEDPVHIILKPDSYKKKQQSLKWPLQVGCTTFTPVLVSFGERKEGPKWQETVFQQNIYEVSWKNLRYLDGKMMTAQPSPALAILECCSICQAEMHSSPSASHTPQRRPLVLFLKIKFLDTRPTALFQNFLISQLFGPWTVYPMKIFFCSLSCGLKWLLNPESQCQGPLGLSLAYVRNGNMRPSGHSHLNSSFNFIQEMACTVEAKDRDGSLKAD